MQERFKLEGEGFSMTTSSRDVAKAVATQRSEKAEIKVTHERASQDGWIGVGSMVFSRGREHLRSGSFAPKAPVQLTVGKRRFAR